MKCIKPLRADAAVFMSEYVYTILSGGGGSDSDDDTRYNPTDFRSSVAFFNGATVSQNTLDTSLIVEIR